MHTPLKQAYTRVHSDASVSPNTIDSTQHIDSYHIHTPICFRDQLILLHD